MEGPLTPPTGDNPADKPPPPLPYQQLSQVSDLVKDVTESVAGGIHDRVGEAVELLDEVQRAVIDYVATLTGDAEAEYDQVGNSVISYLGALIGYAHLIGQDFGLPDVDEGQLLAAAAALPFPGGGVPPVPPRPVPVGPVMPPQLVERFPAGSPIPVYDLGPPPPAWEGTTVSIPGPVPPGPTAPPAGVPPTGTPAGPAPGAPPAATPTAPATPSRPTTSPAAPTLTPTYDGGDTITYYPPAGGGPVQLPAYPEPVAPTPPAAPPPPSGPGPTAGPPTSPEAPAAAGGAGAPCPPITINVNCTPGTVVTAGGGDNVTVTSTTTSADNRQFIDYTLEERQQVQREREPFLFPDDAEGPLAIWLRANFGAPRTEEVAKRLQQEADAAATEREALFAQLRRWSVCDTAQLEKGARELMRDLFRWLVGTDDGRGVTKTSQVGGWIAQLPDWAHAPLIAFVTSVAGLAKLPIDLTGAVTGCEGPGLPLVMALRGLLDVVERWVGASFPEVHTRLDQVAGNACAVGLPGPDEADGARLVNEIDRATWVCWVRAAGRNHEAQLPIYLSKSLRLNALQTVEYANRMQLGPDDSRKELRRVGVAIEEDQDRFIQLGVYVPGPSDLVSFMVRDVFDDQVVKLYGYDEEFESKFAGRVKEWARAQGMTEDQFRYYWRAHWQLPSPTQGYEMIHRLRPGRVGDELVTTKETIRQLLEINDVPKFWRDRLVEISYLPLTRVDLRRALFIGALSEAEVLEGIKDRGYNDRDAELLLRYWKMERRTWVMNQPFMREYVQGFTSGKWLDEELESRGMQEDDKAAVQVLAVRQMQKRESQTLAKSIRQRVVRGLADWEQATKELTELGFSAHEATQRARMWEAERKAKGKHATLAMLCEWFDRNLIAEAEYVEALGRIGYDPGQIALIVRTCRDKGAEKSKKRDAREKAAAATAEKKAVTEQHKEALRRNVERARQSRAAKIRQASEERVQRRLGASTAALAAKLGGNGERYVDGVRAWFALLVNEKGYSRDGAAQMVDGVVVDHAIKAGPNWLEAGRDFVELLPAFRRGPADPDQVEPDQLGPPLVEPAD